MSRIVFIRFDPSNLSKQEFAAWNYPGNENAAAYNSVAKQPPEKEGGNEPEDPHEAGKSLLTSAVFDPFPRGSAIFSELNRYHDPLISAARDKIREVGKDYRPLWSGVHFNIRLIVNKTGLVDGFEDVIYTQKVNENESAL